MPRSSPSTSPPDRSGWRPGTTLDYRERRNTYTVDVTARNIFGATATTRVTITVTSAALGSLGSRYDADNNEVIDLESSPAIADYFNDRISLEELLEVIRLYFRLIQLVEMYRGELRSGDALAMLVVARKPWPGKAMAFSPTHFYFPNGEMPKPRVAARPWRPWHRG